MSYEKMNKVISYDEYNKLVREAAEARDAKRALELIQQANKLLTNKLNKVENQLQDATNAAANAMAKANAVGGKAEELAKKLNDTIKATNKAFQEEKEKHKKDIADLQSRIEKAEEKANKKFDDLDAKINVQVAGLKAAINAITANMTKLGNDLDDYKKMAQVHLDFCKVLQENVLKMNEDHREALLPNEWEKLEDEIKKREKDVTAAGNTPVFAPTAFNNTEKTFDEVNDFYKRLNVEELKWQDAFENAKLELAKVLVDVDESSFEDIIKNAHGKDEINALTENALDEIGEAAKSLVKLLETDRDKLTIGQLDAIRENAKELSQEVAETIVWAKICHENAGRRDALAKKVFAEMKKTGFSKDKYEFVENNHKNANELTIVHKATGIKAVINISGKTNDEGKPTNIVTETVIIADGIRNPDVEAEVKKVLEEKLKNAMGENCEVVTKDIPVKCNANNVGQKAKTLKKDNEKIKAKAKIEADA